MQLDCGIHPGLEGMDALPYIDLIDPAEIDLLLISQWVHTEEEDDPSSLKYNIQDFIDYNAITLYNNYNDSLFYLKLYYIKLNSLSW